MASTFKSSRAIRWAVPVGAIAVVGAAAGAGPVIAAAQGRPSLPPKTAAQLLTAVQEAHRSGKVQPFSGTVVENASLGLPALPGIGGGGTSLMSLLSGSNTARVWYGDEKHVRLALLGTGSETDLIRNGQDVWEWNSEANTATYRRAADKPGRPEKAAPTETPLTPQQAADRALAAIDKTTEVRVDPTARVAGRDVYELVLTPKDGRSLIGRVRLALDGGTYVPLRVQVFARGANSPAAQIGFTSVTFSKPAAANFSFTPPSGAKVVRPDTSKPAPGAKIPGGKGPIAKTLPGRAQAGGRSGDSSTIGSGWTAVKRLTLPQNSGQPGQKDQRAGILSALQKAATPVSGSWGSGRLLRTKLVSALLTDDGRVYVGAVTPDVLEQAAAHK
ncbi:sigma-E factor regulatory protein RseB domain-containing protein [Actinoallomurus sp. NPDC052308]|uniref:LolA family protein n=1 Tax=Actinoallomurus sp. NPDC052308 TaxID=3155530 RepID=UPI003436A8A0